MGAWGVGSFQNDDAMDLVGDVEDSGWPAIVGALTFADQPGYLEAPAAARAIAACELIAAMRGYPAKNLPDLDLAAIAPKAAEVIRARDSAKQVLDRVRSASELRELWEEAGDLSRWESTLDDLRERVDREPSRGPTAKRPRIRLAEGACFVVPLPSGGYALCVLSQLLGGKLPFGYFFGPRRPSPPLIEDFNRLNPSDAVLRVKFGDTEIQNGRWTDVGRLNPWRPDAWPTPAHTSGDAGHGMVYRVEYRRNAPKEDVVRMQRVRVEETSGLEPDIVMGARALERKLDQKIPIDVA